MRIVDAAIEHYARTLPPEAPPAPDIEDAPLEQRAAFSLTLNAINFGSGWFPTLRKPSGLSGFRTIEAGLRARGPWTAAELSTIETAEVAATFGQDPAHELMALYTRALRELGDRVTVEYFGRFLGLVNSAEGSAERLAGTLATWPTWRDISPYEGGPVPFYKRAQIAAADLHLSGVARAEDIDRLTLFADNLVPHVLRLDGILRLDPRLIARVDAEQLIEHDSPEEVELRACAVHAVELIVAARPDLSAQRVDQLLWTRGGGARYKAVPRPRARCTAY